MEEKEIYRQCFASLICERTPCYDKDLDMMFNGHYIILIDGNFETETYEESDEKAIEFFKEYFKNKH